MLIVNFEKYGPWIGHSSKYALVTMDWLLKLTELLERSVSFVEFDRLRYERKLASSRNYNHGGNEIFNFWFYFLLTSFSVVKIK